MKTFVDIAETLRTALTYRQITEEALQAYAGVSHQTLTKALTGTDDYEVSALLALANHLGMELVLVPKGAARVIDAGPTVTEPIVKTRVQAALDRVKLHEKKE